MSSPSNAFCSRLLGLLLLVVGLTAAPAHLLAQASFYNMSAGDYLQTFDDIASWLTPTTNSWQGLAVNATGTIPSATRITAASTNFVTGSSGGVQKGTAKLQLLSTGTTDNSTSTAIDLLLNFAGRNAGNLIFDAATVFNSTGNRAGTLRVYYSIDGTTWAEVTGGGLPYVATNNVATASVISNALPAAINNAATTQLRFYYNNGGANTNATITGSRPKISLDNVLVTSTPASAGAPVITSATTDSAVAFQSYNYQITASNSPTSYAASNLPTGLAVNTSTGLISGSPTATGVYPIPIFASNAQGTGGATLTLTVTKNPGAPTITSALTAIGDLGSPFNYQITADNSPTSYSSGTLPAGLSLDTGSGLISGTPTAGGTFNVSITASNSLGSDTKTLVVTINSPPVITSPLSGSLYTTNAFGYTITASFSPTSFGASGLPDGWTVDTTTGAITSGATPLTLGSTSFQISATNSFGSTSNTYTLAVYDQTTQNAVPLNVLVNKYVNAAVDKVQLLVVGDNTPGSTADLRGMIVKDFSTSMANDSGGKFIFAANALWSSVRAGTFIALSAGNTQPEDIDPSDFYLAVNLGNTNYFANGGGSFDIATTDMLMVKQAGSGVSGVAGGIHALAGGTAGAQFTAFTGAKLITTGTSGTELGVVALNSTASLTNFGVAGAVASTDAQGGLAATNLNFASWNNTNNQAYVESLRLAVATINASPSTLTNLTATQGAAGVSTNFLASASNLSNNITVLANDAVNFAISTNNIAFTNALTLVTNATGGLSNTPVYVRLTGVAQGAQSNTISLVSGSTSTNVIVTGTVSPPPVPSLTATPAAITNLGTTAGTPSDAQAFTASGTALSNNITVSANDTINFAVSTNSTNGFAGSLTLTNNGGSVPATPVYVRLTASSAGSFTNTVSLLSGALSTNVTVAGTVSSTNDPFVDVDPLALGGFAALVGNASTNQTVSVTGANLSNPVQVTATGPFEVSTNGTDFGSSVSVPLSGGVLTFTNSTNWVAPAGVSFIQVECWGAGGAGGSALRATTTTSRNYAGGGAGGAYAKVTNLPVTSGSTYAVNIGLGASNSSSNVLTTVSGGDTWFGASVPLTTNVFAKGGQGAPSIIGDLNNSTVPTRFGAGGVGTATGSFGDVVFAGGSGSAGSETNVAGTGGGGGGGSSAGSSSTGASATSAAGATAPSGGGNGGGGAIGSTNGTNGVRPGGGGGGGATTSTTTLLSGGAGGNGQIVITAPPFFPQTTVFVRMSPGAVAGTNTGTLNITSAGAPLRTVNLSGIVSEVVVPAVTAAPSSLGGFSTTVGTPSTAQTFNASGSNLTANITITAPTGYAVSTNGTTFASSVSLTPSGGTVASTQISVRLTGASAGSPSGNVTVASTGATTQNVAVSGTVNTPIVNASPASLSGFSTTVGTPSTAQTFNASGFNLTANITITAPTGYAVSTNGTTFASSVSLTPSGGTVASTQISVRLTGASAGSPSGNVTVASTGATTQNVAVSGTVNTLPPSLAATPPSLTNFSTVAGTASAAQSYALSGSNLGSVSITAPTGFQVALTNTNAAFAGALTITNNGTLNTNIFVRVSAGAATNTNLVGVISNVSGTASTNVSLQARVVPAPTLSAVPTALSNFSTILGIASTNQPFSLSANNLLGPVNLTVSNGYEISFSTNSGFTTGLVVAPTNAFDVASNYTSATWTNGANQGSGFGPWALPGGNGGTGFNGAFIGPATNTLSNYAPLYTGGVAFSIYAGGSGSAFQDADRNLERPLAVGETLTHSFGIAFDNGNKGFDLYNGTNQVFNFNVNSSGYSWTGGNTAPPTPYPTNREFGAVINFSFTRTTNGFTYAISSPQDSNLTRSGSLTNGGIDRLKYYISGAGGGDPGNIYFNNFQVAYTGGNISNLPVYVRLATNAPIAEATNSLLSRVTISSTAVPLPGVLAAAASSPIYNAYNDFYLSPTAAGWTGATNPSAAGAAWGYYMGNVNGNGGFPLNVGSYLTPGQLYKLSSVGPLSSDPTKYSTSLWDNTGGAGFPRYQANIPGWSTSLGSFSTPWFDGAPGFGTSLSNALWLQSSYLGNVSPSPNGPAEGIASVLTWTAPVTGSYSFSGRFVAGNQPANSAAVSIVDSLGGTNLPRTVLSNSSTQSISFTKSYNAGDTVQFQVGNNFSTGNAVGLQINVAPAAESSNVFAYVDLSGTVANRPSISLSTNAVSGLSATNGYPGVSTNFAVSGRSLTNDIVITVTPATNYQISADNSVFTNTLTLARSNGIVSSNTIYVRIAASAPVSTNPNSLPGNVAFVSPSASTNLSLSGRVFEDVSIPVVETGTNALAGLATVEGTASASTNFTVNGRYLRGNIVVTAPANFAVSTNNLNFAAGVQLPPGVDRIVPPTPVFVRIAENASAGAVTGNVVLNSSNLPAPANVLVSGTVTNWSVANPYGIRVTNPVDFVSTDKGNFTFSGQFGTALDSAMLSWFNLANGVSNGFTGNANRTWSTSVPLDAGINTLVFSGQYLTNAGTTNTAGDTAGDGAYGPPGGWVSGDNGGFGFGPWQLYSEDGLSALYRADVWSATNMNVSAFYGFAFESIVGGLASAHRPFAADLQAPGGSFSVYFDNNNVQPQGSVGLQLVSSNKTPLFTFSAVNDGSGPAYQIGNKTNSAIRPGWAYTQSGLLLRFEMTSSNGYVFTASGSNFTNTNTGTILGLPVAGVTFFADGAGPAPESNFYVGQMQQRRTIYQLETVSTVAPDVERTSPPTSAYKIWAQSFGLDPAGNGAPGADPDKDGYTNDMEFAFGTNPVVATTRPMLQARQSGADLVVSFLARNAGVSYAVLQKSNLAAASPAWADVAVSLVKDADQSGIADPVNYTRRSFTVPATGQNFYRVRATVSQ